MDFYSFSIPYFGVHYLLPTLFMIAMVVDYFRRRPEWYWLAVILLLGPLGSAIYFVVHVAPDLAGMGAKLLGTPADNRRIDELLARLPLNPTEHLHAELGLLYYRKRRYHKALYHLEEALAKDPTHLQAMYYAARIKIRRGATDDGYELLRWVVADNPYYDYGHALLELARLSLSAGRPQDAKEYLDQLLGKFNYLEARYYYAMVLTAEGEHEQAKILLRRVVADGRALPGYKKRTERRWIRKARLRLRGL